ncbi:MAG: hypothetical protein V5A55_03745 [Halovenus sp.]
MDPVIGGGIFVLLLLPFLSAMVLRLVNKSEKDDERPTPPQPNETQRNIPGQGNSK